MSKALIVDDSRAIRMILGRTLGQLGYDVQEAGDGLQALEILDRQPADFNLALVDWNMPGMNGMDLLLRLRADRRYDALPIVMVTTETEMEHVAAAVQAGANEYVMKPFTSEVLRDKLRIAGIQM